MEKYPNLDQSIVQFKIFPWKVSPKPWRNFGSKVEAFYFDQEATVYALSPSSHAAKAIPTLVINRL